MYLLYLCIDQTLVQTHLCRGIYCLQNGSRFMSSYTDKFLVYIIIITGFEFLCNTDEYW